MYKERPTIRYLYHYIGIPMYRERTEAVSLLHGITSTSPMPNEEQTEKKTPMKLRSKKKNFTRQPFHKCHTLQIVLQGMPWICRVEKEDGGERQGYTRVMTRSSTMETTTKRKASSELHIAKGAGSGTPYSHDQGSRKCGDWFRWFRKAKSVENRTGSCSVIR